MHIKKEILNQSHSGGVSVFYLSLLPSHCCLQMKSWLNCCEFLYVIYVIHIAFLKDEKHIEHFLYLTIYSISSDYETSVGFRNSRSEKAQGASLFTPNLRTEHKGSSPSFCFLTIYDHPYTIKYTKYFIVKGWSHSKKTYSPWSCGQKTREALFVGWQYISFRWDDAGNIQVLFM